MQPDELTIEVTDRDLHRVGQIPQQLWTDVQLGSRLRAVGQWSLSLPAELDITAALRQPGAGILVTGPTGEVFSGPMVSAVETADQSDPAGTVTFDGVDWNVLLADDAAYPTPANGLVTTQVAAYDVRSGIAETVARGLVDQNIGPAAPPSRRGWFASKLTLAANLGRGGTVSITSRFDNLLGQVAQATKVGGLGFRTVTTPTAGLQVQFFVPADRSREIRLDLANGQLSKYEYAVTAPTVTRAIVGGQGEGADRTFLTVNPPDAVAAETAWGRRIQAFKDERNTNDPAELAQAGADVLADGGRTAETLKLTPTDAAAMRYQRDWFLGDYITAVVKGREIGQVVTQAGLSATKDGIVIGAVVGDPDADDLRALALIRRVSRLETRS